MSETTFLTVRETAALLKISVSHAYKVIHRLNQELEAQGILTIAGRISRSYLLERTAATNKRKDERGHGSL